MVNFIKANTTLDRKDIVEVLTLADRYKTIEGHKDNTKDINLNITIEVKDPEVTAQDVVEETLDAWRAYNENMVGIRR